MLNAILEFTASFLSWRAMEIEPARLPVLCATLIFSCRNCSCWKGRVCEPGPERERNKIRRNQKEKMKETQIYTKGATSKWEAEEKRKLKVRASRNWTTKKRSRSNIQETGFEEKTDASEK